MPCRAYPPDGSGPWEDTRRLDAATRAACEAFHLLSAAQISKMSRHTQTWWERHQEADRRRLAAERQARERAAARKKALSKLSDADRKALGL